MIDRLSIALTADPELPVPPKFYGGIERIVDLLAQGLSRRGHKVTLFAHHASSTACNLVPWPGGSSRSHFDSLRNAYELAMRVQRERFDLVHSFSRLAYLAPILPAPFPKIMSYQRQISRNTTSLAYAASRGTLEFTAVSRWMVESVQHIGRWHVIPNGVDLTTYTFQSHVSSDAPLVFLGRLEEIKGPHLAIEIARRTGRRLIIAGNIPDESKLWVEAHVLPHVDGIEISYIGPIDDAQKNHLLGRARAFLMPISWDEPFGIVMAEALACGTPVVGMCLGAVPEVVIDGVTGFVRQDIDGLVMALANIERLSRAACRTDAEARFSSEAIVSAYEALYHAALERRNCR
jgi:glycosyltransferase involved in cell wall biosynthesis